jgi:hypothetical protein
MYGEMGMGYWLEQAEAEAAGPRAAGPRVRPPVVA